MKFIKILAKVGPNGEPMAMPSDCLQHLLLNRKCVSRTDRLRSLSAEARLRPCQDELLVGKALSSIMLIVACKGTLVNNHSTSKLTMYVLVFWDKIELENSKELMKVYSLVIKSDSKGTKCLVMGCS